MEKKRDTKWTFYMGGNEFIKRYINCDYKKAFVRVLTEESAERFNQYFQISFIDDKGNHNFKSFRIYDDEEEQDIKSSLPEIQEAHKIKM